MKMGNLSSDDGLSGVKSMGKFLVRAYSQRARKVNHQWGVQVKTAGNLGDI
jgi:hypothetical protein